MNLKVGDLQSYFTGFSWIWSIDLIRGINYKKDLGQPDSLRVRDHSGVTKFEVTCPLCVGQMKDKVVIKTRTASGKEIVSPFETGHDRKPRNNGSRMLEFSVPWVPA